MGRIDSYMLIGGGDLLCFCGNILKQRGMSVLVVTSERHSKETVTYNGRQTMFIDCLRGCGIECIVSDDICTDGNVLPRIKGSTIGLSFGAAWIFRKKFIDLFDGRLLNMHGARLPQDRGAGDFSWRIMRGERIGVSLIHRVDTGVDTGKILVSEEYLYPPECRIPADYRSFSVERNKNFLTRFFDAVDEKKEFDLIKQQESFGIYWPRLNTAMHGYINWTWSLENIEKFICAFDDPYQGASSFVNGSKVRLKKCCSVYMDGGFHPFQKGFIYRITDMAVFVAAEQGSLMVCSITDENGDNVRNSLHVGDRFFTPSACLEEAIQYRAVYTPKGLK